MALDPEPIRVALLERLQKYVTDIARWWESDPGIEEVERYFPGVSAILLTESIRGDSGAGLPTLWELSYQLSIVMRRTREDQAPDTVLNAAFVQVQAAMLLQDGEVPTLQDGDEVYTTLGGLAVKCRILGDVEFLPGVKPEQCGITVPIGVTAYTGSVAGD